MNWTACWVLGLGGPGLWAGFCVGFCVLLVCVCVVLALFGVFGVLGCVAGLMSLGFGVI